MTDLRESVARAIAKAYAIDTTPGLCIEKADEYAAEVDDRWLAEVDDRWLPEASAALRAVADAGPTDAMIEAAARALCAQWWLATGTKAKTHSVDAFTEANTRLFRDDARAAIAAALKEMGAT